MAEDVAEQAFVDADLARVRLWRDRILGRWAARLMGMRAAAIEEYAGYLAASNLAQTGDDEIIRAVSGNLKDCGVVGPRASEARLRRKIERLQEIALRGTTSKAPIADAIERV